MDRTLLILTALAALVVAVPVNASECIPTTSNPEVDVDTTFSRHYVDNDVCQIGCVFSIWYYEESNGIDGLQRWDETHDDTCGGMIEPDIIIS